MILILLTLTDNVTRAVMENTGITEASRRCLRSPVSCCHYNMKGLQNLHEAMGNGCSPGMVVFMFRATRHPAAPNQTFVHSVACKDGVPPLKGRAEWFISVRAGTEERLGHRI